MKVVCIDVNIDPTNDKKETLDEIKRRLQECLKDMKGAKLIKRYKNVYISMWELI
jgi:uncharacterized protein YpuA (DUF1002 family)